MEYNAGVIQPSDDFPACSLFELTRDTMAANTGVDTEVPEAAKSVSPTEVKYLKPTTATSGMARPVALYPDTG